MTWLLLALPFSNASLLSLGQPTPPNGVPFLRFFGSISFERKSKKKEKAKSKKGKRKKQKAKRKYHDSLSRDDPVLGNAPSI